MKQIKWLNWESGYICGCAARPFLSVSGLNGLNFQTYHESHCNSLFFPVLTLVLFLAVLFFFVMEEDCCVVNDR